MHNSQIRGCDGSASLAPAGLPDPIAHGLQAPGMENKKGESCMGMPSMLAFILPHKSTPKKKSRPEKKLAAASAAADSLPEKGVSEVSHSRGASVRRLRQARRLFPEPSKQILLE